MASASMLRCNMRHAAAMAQWLDKTLPFEDVS
jgi:hypothetical protein